MNKTHFETQMKRLSAVFPNAYSSSERVEVIYKAVCAVEEETFTRIITGLIGSSKYAPLVPDFLNQMSLEREKNRTKGKEQEKKDGDEFWGNYHNDEKHEIGETIRNRARGLVGDTDWESFLKVLSA